VETETEWFMKWFLCLWSSLWRLFNPGHYFRSQF